ncbi:hypothetical protein [Lactobacillus porci]|uniref:Uncharacterized protein n=1 Tax=Lactobacillus porci TaxID=2012477 RepID=A0A6A8MGF5_9LACO|nr:hypothetical protein [Lactobacillus porci]MST87865.1 hypothetical protein [Lactobacillus porci]
MELRNLKYSLVNNLWWLPLILLGFLPQRRLALAICLATVGLIIWRVLLKYPDLKPTNYQYTWEGWLVMIAGVLISFVVLQAGHSEAGFFMVLMISSIIRDLLAKTRLA